MKTDGRLPPFKPQLRQKIRDNEKTETRRLRGLDRMNESPNEWTCDKVLLDGRAVMNYRSGYEIVYVKCPYGRVGQVRHLIEPLCRWEDPHKNHSGYARYADDHDLVTILEWAIPVMPWRWSKDWLSSIHMPNLAARTFRRITDIRVERVQDITEEGAIAEGVLTSMEYPFENGELPCPSCQGQGVHGALGPNLGVMEVDCFECNTMRKRFKILWDSINAPRGHGWEKNDWVWVVKWEPVGE